MGLACSSDYMNMDFPVKDNSSLTGPVNYNCPECKKSGKLPNIAGKFFVINEDQCKCNGCNKVFEKSEIYIKPQNLDQSVFH